MTTQQQTEHFTWLVEYADGSRTAEYDSERPDGRGWLEVKQEGITVLYLLDPDMDTIGSHRVLIPPGAYPVFLRRRLIQMSPDGEVARATAHCIGWRHGERGVYLFVFADGSSVLTDNLQAV